MRVCILTLTEAGIVNKLLQVMENIKKVKKIAKSAGNEYNTNLVIVVASKYVSVYLPIGQFWSTGVTMWFNCCLLEATSGN